MQIDIRATQFSQELITWWPAVLQPKMNGGSHGLAFASDIILLTLFYWWREPLGQRMMMVSVIHTTESSNRPTKRSGDG
jgi:hypothetical protein